MNSSQISFHKHEWLPYIFAITFSLLISAWIIAHEVVINADGICYVMSAEAINNLGLVGAMHLCAQSQWPFFSILIYCLATLTHLNYVFAAHVLDASFSALSVGIFTLIVKTLGGNKRTIWLAAIVILLAYQFNSVREYIIRDHGFWAFYLTSIWLLLKYFQQPRLWLAFLWSISLLIATLFRVEGAIFLLLLPFTVWFLTPYLFRTRLQFFLQLHSLFLFILLILTLWLITHPQQSLPKLGRVSEIINQFQHGFISILNRYQIAKTQLAQYVLTKDSSKDAGQVLFVMMSGWYLVSVISNLTIGYSILLAYGLYRRAYPFAKPLVLVVVGYLLVNILITSSFLLERFFLSKRYLIALSLILMFLVPFALDKLLAEWGKRRQRIFAILVACGIFISALGGIFDFGYSKNYLHRAGNWLATNVPTDKTLYANDYQLMYYSQHFRDDLFVKLPRFVVLNNIAHGQWKQYDYLALRLDKKDQQAATILQEFTFPPVQIFQNKRGDKVVIYKTQ